MLNWSSESAFSLSGGVRAGDGQRERGRGRGRGKESERGRGSERVAERVCLNETHCSASGPWTALDTHKGLIYIQYISQLFMSVQRCPWS